MITRRRRQGSESEHQLSAESELQHQVLKGPSSVLLWTGENQHQQEPSFFILPQSGSAVIENPIYKPNTVDFQGKPSPDTMALASGSGLTVLSSTNASSRDRTDEFHSAVRSFQSRSVNGGIARPSNPIKNSDHHVHYSEFMKVAKYVYIYI